MDQEKVRIVREHNKIDARYSDQLREPARRELAHAIADRLLRENVITFSESQLPHDLAFLMTATVGVVSPDTVTTIERRAISYARNIADRVAHLAVESISMWGRDFNLQDIPKDQAMRDVIRASLAATKEFWVTLAGQDDCAPYNYPPAHTHSD